MDTPVCHLVLIRSSLALVAWLNFRGVIRFAGTWRLSWSQTIPQAEATLHHCNFMLIERYLSQCSRQFQIFHSLSNSLPLLFSLSHYLFLFVPLSFFSFHPSLLQTLLQLKKSQRNYSVPVNVIVCVGLCGCVTLSHPFVNTSQRICCIVLKDCTDDCSALFIICHICLFPCT